MPLSLPGCRTKAESPSLAGFAPSPRETDLPGLRKAEATLTGLRFTREKETDIGEQIKRSLGTEKRSQASFLQRLLFPWPGHGFCATVLLLSSSSRQLPHHHSPRRIPASHPLGFRYPISGRAQITNHTSRPESKHQSRREVRGRAFWHPMETSTIRIVPR